MDDSSKYPISKGIPMPRRRGGGGSFKPAAQKGYPWHDLEVVDSFCAGKYKKELMINICNAKSKVKGKEFAARKVNEDGSFVVRVWRTK